LRGRQVALCVQGCNVGIDYGCHGVSPDLVLPLCGDVPLLALWFVTLLRDTQTADVLGNGALRQIFRARAKNN
jgi:hypothetical protein